MNGNERPVAISGMDYEREYRRLIKENANLMEENDILRKTIIEMCKKIFAECADLTNNA